MNMYFFQKIYIYNNEIVKIESIKTVSKTLDRQIIPDFYRNFFHSTKLSYLCPHQSLNLKS